MTLRQVQCTWDVFHTCATHALSTEREEIMGLLLGHWESDEGEVGPDAPHTVVHVRDVKILVRSDRRKDRVEISTEQLWKASEEAAEIEKRDGQPTRVVGWYHSHPHITVFPSHVDNRTQGQFQALDGGFVGLIFSVFNHNARDQSGQVLATAFQAKGGDGAWQRRDVPLSLRAAVGGGDGGGVGGGGGGGGSSSSSSSSSGGGGGSSSSTSLLQRLAELQRTFGDEERALFDAAAAEAPAHPLHLAHCSAVYGKAMCQLLELCALPLRQTLAQRLEMARRANKEMAEENGRLRDAAAAANV